MSQPPPDTSNPATPLTTPHEPAVAEYSAADRTTLLEIAHRAIEAAVRGERYRPEARSGPLTEPRGVFTTLYLAGQLRGCIGYILPSVPLYLAVAETSQAAALEDPRFFPVEPAEAARLQVSLSVLSSTQPIDPTQIAIGRHGLIVSHQGRRGLLLPQVAEEHGWDVATFLAETCYKAGLPRDAWKHGARIEAFTAEIFADPGAPP